MNTIYDNDHFTNIQRNQFKKKDTNIIDTMI